MRITCRTMLYKAIRLPDGKLICVHSDHLSATTRIVADDAEYDRAVALGWCEGPQEAMARGEAAEDAISLDAAIRAYDDRRLTPDAQAEAETVESRTIRHLPEIPEGPKKRGRKAGA